MPLCLGEDTHDIGEGKALRLLLFVQIFLCRFDTSRKIPQTFLEAFFCKFAFKEQLIDTHLYVPCGSACG